MYIIRTEEKSWLGYEQGTDMGNGQAGIWWSKQKPTQYHHFCAIFVAEAVLSNYVNLWAHWNAPWGILRGLGPSICLFVYHSSKIEAFRQSFWPKDFTMLLLFVYHCIIHCHKEFSQPSYFRQMRAISGLIGKLRRNDG